jgi:hypothetical protein
MEGTPPPAEPVALAKDGIARKYLERDEARPLSSPKIALKVGILLG